jgi:hypothetical protein
MLNDRPPMKQERKPHPRREELKQLSAGLLILKKEGIIDSVNDGLVAMYEEQGHTQLHSFWGWKKEGFSVKKGSKALVLWGRPVKKEQDDSEDGFKFFPVCYVFSEHMVEPIKEKATA